MHQPLLEPAVLVSENCAECQGTGKADALRDCVTCDASGRQVSEVPMSIAFGMMRDYQGRATAPPPSVLREQARRTSE